MPGTVVVTGIPGVGKTTVLRELEGISAKNGFNLTVLNFGTVMNDIFKSKGKGLDRDEMHSEDVALQRQVQDRAAETIEREARGKAVIVDTHMFVRTATGLWSGLPQNVLFKLKPKALVLLEVDPKEVAKRRKTDRSRSRPEPSVDQIAFDLAWSRSVASACSVLTGAPVQIIRNEKGKHRDAAEALLRLVRKQLGE